MLSRYTLDVFREKLNKYQKECNKDKRSRSILTPSMVDAIRMIFYSFYIRHPFFFSFVFAFYLLLYFFWCIHAFKWLMENKKNMDHLGTCT